MVTDEVPEIWRDLPRTRSLDALDRHLFEVDVLAAHRPCILRGQAADWPIVTAGRAGPEALDTYLRRHATDRTAELWVGPGALDGRFRYTPDFRAMNFERRLATIPQICELLKACRGEPSPPSLFAGAIYLPDVLPGILPELPLPLLAETQSRVTSLWIGNGSRTAAHYDRPHNLATAVAGARTFLLFPTAQVRNLYVGPVDFTIAGQAISLVDCENPDYDRHPRFRDALAAAELAVLTPGDTLYIPPLWWHYVRSVDPMGALVNAWWMAEPADRLSPMDTLMHALLTLRHLSPEERDGWKSIFAHYVFEADPADLAHIPPQGLGVLGEMDEAARGRLRRYLADQLGRKT